MSNANLSLRVSTYRADLVTPVGIYLGLRDLFPGSFLLESGDYRGSNNSVSYICIDPCSHLRVQERSVEILTPEGELTTQSFSDRNEVLNQLERYRKRFSVDLSLLPKGIYAGLFGYFGYDAISYFDDIRLKAPQGDLPALPEIQLFAFRYTLAIDHFREELYLIELVVGQQPVDFKTYEVIKSAFQRCAVSATPFSIVGEERSCTENDDFLNTIRQCQAHIRRGDVFQIVPSRRYAQQFQGDPFEVYRALRSINPSPYLFYFDLHRVKVFGSSPESQIVLKEGAAGIFPIAGTYPRSGNDVEDLTRSEALRRDPKESSEHAMLVDLARNDLNRCCGQVHVESYADIQFYSHLIHLVSKVIGKLPAEISPLTLLAQTFPAGTLSGAPKFRAIEILDQLEPFRRQLYGGCLGILSFSGDALFAIIIRSIVSADNTLFYQAGAGIVFDSVPEREVEEISVKLAALRRAIEVAAEGAYEVDSRSR